MIKNNNNWEKNIFVGYCPMLDSVVLTHLLSTFCLVSKEDLLERSQNKVCQCSKSKNKIVSIL